MAQWMVVNMWNCPGETPIYCVTALQLTGMIQPGRRPYVSLQFQRAPMILDRQRRMEERRQNETVNYERGSGFEVKRGLKSLNRDGKEERVSGCWNNRRTKGQRKRAAVIQFCLEGLV